MKVEKWKKSEAKKLLTSDIAKGVVTENMKAREVYELRVEFKKYEYKHFQTNLRNLRKALKAVEVSAAISSVAYENDQSLGLPIRTKKFWPASDACRLLKEDVKSGFFEGVPAQDVWISRVEYQEFNYKDFNNHLRQEIQSQKERSYWSFKKSQWR